MADLNEIGRVYQLLQKKGDGVVTIREICRFTNNLGIVTSEEDLRLAVSNYFGADDCSDRGLQFEEFSDLYNFIFNREQEEDDSDDLLEAFRVFDENRDGYINCEELQRVLSRMGLIPDAQKAEDCQKMICRFDSDCNGVLDFIEFKNMMCATVSP